MGDQEDPHDHMSDDSCSTKRWDDDREGIYASTARKRTYSERSGHTETDQGLTLQPIEQSPDPQPPHAAASMTDAEMQHSLWDCIFSDVDTIAPATRRPGRVRWSRTPSVSTLFSCKNRTKASQQPLPPDLWCDPEPQTSTAQQLSDVPAPRSDQEENSESRTASVSFLLFSKNPTKASRQPAQSDCFASGPQTPERSETPTTPVDHGIASCDLFGDDGEIQGSSELDHQQHPVATGATLPESQVLTGDGTYQATQGPFHKIPVVDLTDDSRVASSSLSNRRKFALLRASPTWNCNTPLPSIEGNRLPDRTLPSTPNNPLAPQLASQANNNFAASGIRSAEHVAFAAQHKRSQNAEAIAKASEFQEKEPANQQKQGAHTTTNPSAAQLDPSSSQFFSTFMKFRNSLPLSAAMAMMAPVNQNQILSTLAELSNGRGLTTKPGVAESTPHKVPAAMRAMLDNLKRKFDTDTSFLQSVIVYVTEQLIEDGKNPS